MISGRVFLHGRHIYRYMFQVSPQRHFRGLFWDWRRRTTHPQAPLLGCSSIKSPQEWAACAVQSGMAADRVLVYSYRGRWGSCRDEIQSAWIAMSTVSLGNIFVKHNKIRCKYMQIRGCFVDWRLHAAVCELLKQPVALNLPISCEDRACFFCLSVRDDSLKWANVASEKTLLISQQTEWRICILKRSSWFSGCLPACIQETNIIL